MALHALGEQRGLAAAAAGGRSAGTTGSAPLAAAAARRARRAVVARAQAAPAAHSVVTSAAPAGAARPQQAAGGQPYRVTADTIADVQSLYHSLLYEYDYEIDPAWVEGEIPSDLVGTYVRNGPGLQVNSGRTKRHTFDGDGMILSFSFPGAGRPARFKNKFVRTKGFVEEQAAGRPLYRTAFTRGSADGNPFFNPFDFGLKNCANTGVLNWAGRLYALYESGLPHELDPATLGTLGESTVGGQLQTPVLAAHYRLVPPPPPAAARAGAAGASAAGAGGDGAGRDWIGFSANTGLGGTELLFYEFSGDESSGGRLRHPVTRAPLPGVRMALVHDIAVTHDYYVVHVGPLEFDGRKFVTDYVTSRCSIAECLVYRPDRPSRVWFVPRPGGAAAGQEPVVVDAPASFVFHHANAFQSQGPAGETLVTLDTVAWDTISFAANQYTITPDYYAGGQRTQLRRYVFDLTNRRTVSDARLMRRCAEFPSVNPDAHASPHRHIYCCADIVDDDTYWGPAQSVAKVTVDPAAGLPGGPDPSAAGAVDAWSPGPRCIVNEPLFVPRQGAEAEDDGYIIAAVHNAATGKGELAILDAARLSAGPVATIRLPHFLPAGLHGSFSPRVAADSVLSGPLWAEPNEVKQI